MKIEIRFVNPLSNSFDEELLSVFSGDTLAELQATLEALFESQKEKYNLSHSYDDAKDWIQNLILIPVFDR